MVVSKLDPNTLEVLATYKTNWRKKWAGNAFMACGVLYVLKKYDLKDNYLNYAYDTHTKQWRHIQVSAGSVFFVQNYEKLEDKKISDSDPATKCACDFFEL